MSNNSTKNAGTKNRYANYKLNKSYEKNKRKKLIRALNRNPENKQIEAALANIAFTRKAPKTPYWSHSMIKTAKLFKEFTGAFNRDIFNTNEKISGPALSVPGPYSVLRPQQSNTKIRMFSIGERTDLAVWNSF